MKRKPIFTIMAVLVVIGIYSYEHFLNSEQKAEIVKEGETVKEHTNAYFLPTSTTNQIIHHQN